MFVISYFETNTILRLFGYGRKQVWLYNYEVLDGSNNALMIQWTSNKENALQFTKNQLIEILSIVKTAGFNSAFKEKI